MKISKQSLAQRVVVLIEQARQKSVTLTKAGMVEARRIIAKYGIADWEFLVGTEDWPSWFHDLQKGDESID